MEVREGCRLPCLEVTGRLKGSSVDQSSLPCVSWWTWWEAVLTGFRIRSHNRCQTLRSCEQADGLLRSLLTIAAGSVCSIDLINHNQQMGPKCEV